MTIFSDGIPKIYPGHAQFIFRVMGAPLVNKTMNDQCPRNAIDYTRRILRWP